MATENEFQTITDLSRVRLIRAELDTLESSTNVQSIADEQKALAPLICDVDLMQMRQQLRRWEANLKDAVKIRRSS